MSDRPEPTIQQLFDLSGRVALITGASGHLGSALARALAEAGARVVAASRSIEKARATAAALGGEQQGHHLAVALDQMDEASVERGFAAALQQAGRIDVLVNNGHEALAADWRSVTAGQFTRQLANVTGYFLLSRLMHDEAVTRGAAASIITPRLVCTRPRAGRPEVRFANQGKFLGNDSCLARSRSRGFWPAR